MDAKQLQKLKSRLYSTLPLVGGWLRREAAEALAQDDSPEAVHALAEAVTRSKDEQVRAIALNVLQQLAAQGNAEAQEALCHLVIEHDHPTAREIAIAAGYAPRETGQRALFYFLSEQWEKYEALDFDHSLLRAVYETADEQTRRRIMEKARRAGRVEWVMVATGGRMLRRLGEMTDAEWEAALAVLEGGKRWEEMWRLAQEAPPRWSARVLRGLGKRMREWGNENKGGEREGYEELVGLAERLEVEELDSSWVERSQTMLEGHTDQVMCLSFSPDGRLLASGGFDTVRLWSVPEWREFKRLEGHTGCWYMCLSFSPNGQFLATGENSGVRLWSVPEGREMKRLEGPLGNCLSFSPDGRFLAGGSDDDTVRLWSVSEGREVKRLEGHTETVDCLSFSPDGRFLASGGGVYIDHTVRLWSVPEGREVKRLEGHTRTVRHLSFSPDGRFLASGSQDNTVRLWSVPEGQEVKTLRGYIVGATCLSFSPDGRFLASGSQDNTVRLWSVPEGQEVKELKHTGLVGCLSFDPDGRFLASADDTVRLWSVPEGREVKTLRRHTDFVSCLSFSPDGRFLASGSWDKTVRLWATGLLHLSRLPVRQMTLKDLAWVEETRRSADLSAAERQWLEFTETLMRWRRRFDIQLAEAPRRIAVGEFDIEIER
jgi:WD40 repeat protein